MTNAIATTNAEAYRTSTDAAGLCRDIVIATAKLIQGRNFVSVEGWQAIAIAHGCAASARDVEKIEGGVRAIGEVRRMSDGVVISVAEGFVGEDEPTWYGGVIRGKTLPRRADYAIRAMAQTRAISRACRSAFAHVVVMMKANLETTPAEEVPADGFDNGHVQDAEYRTVSEPAAKKRKVEPLTGPMKTRAEARVKYGDIVRDLHACGDPEMLSAFIQSESDVLSQFERELPQAWNGDGMELLGLRQEIANASARCEEAAA